MIDGPIIFPGGRVKGFASSKLVFAVYAVACCVNPASADTGRTTGPDTEIEATLLKLEEQRATAILSQRCLGSAQNSMDRYYRHVESRGQGTQQDGLVDGARAWRLPVRAV